MHDDLRSNIQNPSQNFYTNSLILKKPQKLFKTQNLGQKRVKCMINEWERIIPDEEHLIYAEDQVRNVKGLSLKSFGVRKERNCQEKSKK